MTRAFVAFSVIVWLLLLWSCWPRAQPMTAKVVEIEGIRAQRMTDEGFARRWSSVLTLPPEPQVETRSSERSEAAASPQQVVRRRPLRTRSSSLDVCARHNMRRVYYGRTWRCRR